MSINIHIKDRNSQKPCFYVLIQFLIIRIFIHNIENQPIHKRPVRFHNVVCQTVVIVLVVVVNPKKWKHPAGDKSPCHNSSQYGIAEYIAKRIPLIALK